MKSFAIFSMELSNFDTTKVSIIRHQPMGHNTNHSQPEDFSEEDICRACAASLRLWTGNGESDCKSYLKIR